MAHESDPELKKTRLEGSPVPTPDDDEAIETTLADFSLDENFDIRLRKTLPSLDSGEGPLVSRIRRYEILSEVARGGMGRVLRAWDSLLRRVVALKVLHKVPKEQHIIAQRFMREGRIIARLEHPGIVPIYEIGDSPEAGLFIAMRFVEGKSFDEVLRERRDDAEDLPRLLKVFEQVCETMAFAHSRNIIHRDLKPANIMLGDFGVVNVMDWGLAKDLDHTNPASTDPELPDVLPHDLPEDERTDESRTTMSTQDGTVLGTIAYLPPEQALGRPQDVDKRADVFTLGGILCTIITGSPPYAGKSFNEVYRKARNGKLDDAHARLNAADVDPQLIKLATECLQKDPDNRPADASHVARVITAIIESNVREAQRDLTRFFELSLDMFCIAGLDGYFRSINANFTRILGISEQDLLAKPFISLIHEDDVAPTMKAMQQLNNGKPVVRFCNRYRTAGGEFRDFEWTASSVPDEGIVYAVARDVTA